MKKMNKVLKTVLRVLTVIVVFIGCVSSLLLVILGFTMGDRSFYIDNISSKETEEAIAARALSYFSEKSNQTTIPLGAFLAGYDEETLNTLVAQRAQDTADFILNGTPYPDMRAEELCDFELPLVCCASALISEYGITETDEIYAEMRQIARESVEYVDNFTCVVNLSSFEGSKFIANLGTFLNNSLLFSANAVLLTAVLAYLLWAWLHKENRLQGAYTTVGTLWLASSVVYSLAVTFRYIRLADRLPVERGTPLYCTAVNMLKEFDAVFMTVSAVAFYGLLAALLVVVWFYCAPKKKVQKDTADGGDSITE